MNDGSDLIKHLAGIIKRPRGAGLIVGARISKDAMPDLDPAAIERLLREAAERRGVPVDAYRDLVQAVADVAGVDFATALRVMAVFEKLPAAERNALFEHLAVIQQQAARLGVSVSRYVRIMLGGGDGEPPIRQ